MCTVEPCLADTPEMWPSIIRTLCSVWNAISTDLHTNRSPEMRTPRYSIKRTLGLAPAVSLPIQTHPYSGQFGTNFIDLLVKQTARSYARNTNFSVSNYHVPHLRGHRSYCIIDFSDRPHPCHIANPEKSTPL